MKFLKFFIFLFFLNISYSLLAQTYEANWASLDKRPIPAWFTDAKFGIFIHWGVYSVPAWAPANEDIGVYAKYAEWYWMRISGGKDPNEQKADVGKMFLDHHNKMYGSNFKYQDFASMFKSQYFKPNEWASIFKDAGAKYVILTSKHHDGFANWPSNESWNWNSADIGPHRDLCGELTKAVKDSGLRMGMYYSLYEWFNPLYKKDSARYVAEHMMPQLKDLVTRYQPEIIYPDGEWDYPSKVWQSEQFLSWLYNESAVKNTVVVNDRWGKETRSKHGGYYSSEYGIVDGGAKVSDMAAHPWEEIRGIGTSFGYNHVEDLNNYSSSKELIDLLINVVANGGNLCLNVGPTADGRIPVIMQQRLHDMGQWLKVNGEAIYGTTVWQNRPKAKEVNTIYYTKKGKDLYVICTKWHDKKIIVHGVNKRSRVSLLGTSVAVKSIVTNDGLTIMPAAINPSINVGAYAWVYKVESVE
ncbi:MAG: alpha-L-fucosidase [Ferruginibacter sp.]